MDTTSSAKTAAITAREWFTRRALFFKITAIGFFALLMPCAGSFVFPARAAPATPNIALGQTSVAAEGVEWDGRLKIIVRCPDAVAFAKSVVVSSDARANLECDVRATSAQLAPIRVAVRPADKTLRIVGDGVDRTLEIPPMMILRRSQGNPGMDSVFSVMLDFSQRLDPAQKPPRLKLTPAVSGVLTHIDGNELVLTGEFPTRTTLRVKLESDLLGADGWRLKAGEEFSVNISERPASAAFDFDSGVLSPNGSLGVPVRLCNLPKVVVSVSRLAPENLVPALHSSSVRDALMEESAKREITLKSAPDEMRRMFFDIRTSADKPGESPCGVRLLRLEWNDARYGWEWQRSDSAFVCVTDIALTPMLDADGRGATVWAVSLTTGKPLPGVALEVRSAQNRVVARGVTGADGLARLAIPGKPGESPAWVVTGRLGEDFSYVQTAAAKYAENDGDLPPRTTGPVVFLYGDRGIWRGGETVRLTGLIRTAEGGAMPDSPLEVRLAGPSGRVFSRQLATPADGGFFAAGGCPLRSIQGRGFAPRLEGEPVFARCAGRRVRVIAPSHDSENVRAGRPGICIGKTNAKTTNVRR